MPGTRVEKKIFLQQIQTENQLKFTISNFNDCKRKTIMYSRGVREKNGYKTQASVRWRGPAGLLLQNRRRKNRRP